MTVRQHRRQLHECTALGFSSLRGNLSELYYDWQIKAKYRPLSLHWNRWQSYTTDQAPAVQYLSLYSAALKQCLEKHQTNQTDPTTISEHCTQTMPDSQHSSSLLIPIRPTLTFEPFESWTSTVYTRGNFIWHGTNSDGQRSWTISPEWINENWTHSFIQAISIAPCHIH